MQTASANRFPVHRLTAISALSLLLVACAKTSDSSVWYPAVQAEEFFASSASQGALLEGEVASLNLSCSELLPAARTSLNNPGSPGARALIDTCAAQGLGFLGEVECRNDALSVSCK
ncbi:hypothetical protein NOR51B_1767 [Luminiphilus syltensis NOR5-1B]|uniref:Lipoprotein n=1 Tax=Luminiphilus syltensis NOR5-1B TaxID=565045 RepID=B8KTV6_9GAMM|nr:hypothetical protein [Luminiphilus syltensis]EED35820.1 hypothetical protein NOR51B_1767 [Luminiphilus syltensis NOR5-1B]